MTSHVYLRAYGKTEINKLFTERVNEYIIQGYWFNLESLGGQQGEVSKVDLTNGKEVIRVLLRSTLEYWHIEILGVYDVIRSEKFRKAER